MAVRNRDGEVWITGLGLATSLGLTFNDLSDNLLAGKSGIVAISQYDTTGQLCSVAANLPPLPTPVGHEPGEFARLGYWEQLTLSVGIEALRDSGLWEQRGSLRIGLVMGLGAEWVTTWEKGTNRGDPRMLDPARDQTGVTEYTRDALGLSGPTATVAAACASGNAALAQARRWLRRGWVDVCLAGACERPVNPMAMAAFANLGALAKKSEVPAAASRPFDRDRDGFVMGEGGVMFVLEPASRARRRGAKAYGEVAGVGMSSDAYHLVIPSSDLGPCSRAMRDALADAEVNPDQLDYVNAHATSTPVGDAFEAKALREVLGESAGVVPVSSTKSMTGHLLSAAAAVEAVACLTAFDRQALPPTINLDNPDPECALNHVASRAMEAKCDVALSNSFGFGGSNICVVFRRVA